MNQCRHAPEVFIPHTHSRNNRWQFRKHQLNQRHFCQSSLTHVLKFTPPSFSACSNFVKTQITYLFLVITFTTIVIMSIVSWLCQVSWWYHCCAITLSRAVSLLFLFVCSLTVRNITVARFMCKHVAQSRLSLYSNYC